MATKQSLKNCTPSQRRGDTKPLLLGLFVCGVLVAKTTKLAHLNAVRVVLFVFECVVVALLAITASQSNFDSHIYLSSFCKVCIAKQNSTQSQRPLSLSHCFLQTKNNTPAVFTLIIPHTQKKVNSFCNKYHFFACAFSHPLLVFGIQTVVCIQKN